MAARLLSCQRMVLFGRSLQIYAKALKQSTAGIRNFSSQGSGDKRHPHVVVLLEDGAEGVTVWPDSSLGLLGPKDVRMPLPGNVGLSHRLSAITPTASPSVPAIDLDLLSGLTNYERQIQILKDSLSSKEEIEELNEEDIEQLLMDLPQPSDVLECVAQDCPELVKKDFSDLFPGRDVSSGPLTVITLTQKTENDMSMWSESVEFEREELTACFIDAAKEICNQLSEAGYWADFIDPTSGRPYLGPYTNASLYETDERYRHFGFTIEDLGCCKVISHRTWGTHSFVGCIFSNAPVNGDILKGVLRRHHEAVGKEI